MYNTCSVSRKLKYEMKKHKDNSIKLVFGDSFKDYLSELTLDLFIFLTSYFVLGTLLFLFTK